MKDRSYEEEMEDYENSIIWGTDWRKTFEEINKEMNMDKLHAIAFGEWLLNADVVEIWCEDGKWLWKSTMFDVDGKYYTTEELYNKFIKSLIPIQW